MSATLGTLAQGSAQTESQYYGYPSGTMPGPSDNSQLIQSSSGPALGQNSTPAVLFMPRRGIAFVVPNVIISEQGTDEVESTDQPVEVGAAITDHAYKQPARLSLRYNWSNSLHGEGYVQQVYAQLLTLQASCQLVTVMTGKRLYPNMLITHVSNLTEADSEYSLPLDIECKQLILVYAKTTTLPPVSQQASPQNTASPQDAGTVQPQPVDRSTLSYMTGSQVIGQNPSHGY